MKPHEEAECRCTFLYTLAKEKNISVNTLAESTGIEVQRLYAIFQGTLLPSLEELIMLGNELDTKLSFHTTIPFAHQKVINKMNHNLAH